MYIVTLMDKLVNPNCALSISEDEVDGIFALGGCGIKEDILIEDHLWLMSGLYGECSPNTKEWDEITTSFDTIQILVYKALKEMILSEPSQNIFIEQLVLATVRKLLEEIPAGIQDRSGSDIEDNDRTNLFQIASLIVNEYNNAAPTEGANQTRKEDH